MGCRDLAEGCVAQSCIGLVELRSIAEIVRLRAELQLEPLGKVEAAEDGAVDRPGDCARLGNLRRNLFSAREQGHGTNYVSCQPRG